jgi:hypothetical protein
MASIIDIYKKGIPTTGKADLKGGDKTKIEADGGLNLSKDDKKLSKARGGQLNDKKYSDSIKNK